MKAETDRDPAVIIGAGTKVDAFYCLVNGSDYVIITAVIGTPFVLAVRYVD